MDLEVLCCIGGLVEGGCDCLLEELILRSGSSCSLPFIQDLADESLLRPRIDESRLLVREKIELRDFIVGVADGMSGGTAIEVFPDAKWAELEGEVALCRNSASCA